MIRHSSSLFISLAVHVTFFVLLLYVWKILPLHEEKKEENICIKLCCVAEIKPEKKIQKETNVVPKKELTKAVQKEKATPPLPLNKVVFAAKKPPHEEQKSQQIVQAEQEQIQPLQAQQPQVQPENMQHQIRIQETPQVQEASLSQVYIQEHLEQLVKLLQENLYYPKSARQRGIEGAVVVKFILQQDATVSHIEVVSSKSGILSQAAITTIENLSGKFPKSDEKLTLEVPIHYNLQIK